MNRGNKIYESNVYDVFYSASSILFDAVSHTLGSNGYNTAIPTSNGFLSIINDGKTILDTISSENPAIKLALNTLKESSFATNQNAGDGTTSTTILQHQLLDQILHFNTVQSEEGNCITAKDVERIRDLLLSELPRFKKEITNKEDLRKVIQVSLGSDELVDCVYDAFQGLPKGHKPSLIKTKNSSVTEVLSIDGVSINPIEVNPVILQNTPASYQHEFNVLIITQKVTRIDQQFASLLNNLSKKDKPTILLYTEIMPSVLDQIMFNIQEGALNVIPIRIAIPVTRLDDNIRELEKYFNCKALTELYPYQTQFNSNDIFGLGTQYILNKDSVIIKTDNEEYSSDILPSKSTVIQVGFITFSQQEEVYRRLEDAINSAYNALISGYTLGAGFTYVSLSGFLQDDLSSVPVSSALNYIFDYLYDAENYTSTQQFINYIEDNVYDSYKVTEQVILNAFTVVAQVLSTRVLLVPIDSRGGLYSNLPNNSQNC